jgi:hypothetical protein
MSRRPIAAGLALLACALAGCTPFPVGPGEIPDDPIVATPIPTATASDGETAEPGGATDCAGKPVIVDAVDAEFELHGECPEVTISGTELGLDILGSVGTITMTGDRIEVDVADAGTIAIAGQANDVDAANIGTLRIAGDRNEVDVDRGIGSVSVQGDDNEVEAATIGSSDDQGDRNDVRVR